MLRQVVDAPGRIIFEEAPVPEIEEDQVLIKIHRIGICNSDIRVYSGRYPGINYPVSQGREAAGEIVSVGASVQNLFAGQKVTVQPQVPCHVCRHCVEGKYNLCKNMKVMGFNTEGMASEYIAVDADRVATLPGEAGYEEGTMIEPLAVAVHAVKKAGNVAGKNVLILGAGPIGVITAQAAKGMGAASVMITDISDSRLRIAKECGIDYCVNTSGREPEEALAECFGVDEADMVYDCAGNDVTLRQAIRCARAGSRIILVAVFKGTTGVDLGAMEEKELKLCTTLMYRNEDYLDAIGLLDDRKVDLNAMISRHFPFLEYEDAYRYLMENRDKVMKVIIDVAE